ncbi:MAG: class I SAM-dependent methyltransferase [Promethearchaeota archaeon]
MQNKYRPKQMRKFYEHIAMADAKEKKRVKSESIEWLWGKLRANSLKLLEIEDGNLVLDIGSGKSTLLSVLPMFSNIRLVCMDLALTHLQRMIPVVEKNRNKVGLIVADAENLPFKENIFDRILLSEVIEHLPNPVSAIWEIKRVLKGKAVITTPNRQNMISSIISVFSSLFRVFRLQKNVKIMSSKCRERELSEAEKYLVQEGHIHHTKIFSISELISLFKSADLQIKRIEGSALDVYPFAGLLDKHSMLFQIYKLLNAIAEKTYLRRYTWSIVLECIAKHQK